MEPSMIRLRELDWTPEIEGFNERSSDSIGFDQPAAEPAPLTSK